MTKEKEIKEFQTEIELVNGEHQYSISTCKKLIPGSIKITISAYVLKLHVNKKLGIIESIVDSMGYKFSDHHTPEELEKLNKFKDHYPEIIEILDDGKGKLISSPGILIPNDDYSPGVDYQLGLINLTFSKDIRVKEGKFTLMAQEEIE